jgi:uncharacterized protein
MRRLTEEDIDALERFLLERGDDETMLLTELDGYLTGIMVCPELLVPSQWLAPIWGNDGPVFEDESEANAILALVMAYYNDIGARLKRPDRYAPRLDVDHRNGSLIWPLWASGFGKALDIAPWAWEPVETRGKDDPAAMALAVLAALATAADTPGVLPAELYTELDAEADALIADCVIDLHSARLASDTDRHPSKVGRNDPCPCGSGRKYKKCCLQAQ